MRINDLGVAIVGVMPAGFVDLAERDSRTIDLWMPLRTAPRLAPTFAPGNRSSRLLWGVGRLRDGIRPVDAERELAALSQQLERDHPQTNRGFGVHATPVRGIFFRELRQPLAMLGAGAAFVLLIVCCNAAVLLLSRIIARHRELSLRLALGASRTRLIRQLLVELLALALAAAAFSLLTAGAATRALLAASAVEFPGFIDVRVDWTIVPFAVGLAFVAALASALLPALAAWRLAACDRLGSLHDGRLVSRGRAQVLLVRLQVGSALVLVAGASLMVASSLALTRAGLDFDTDRLLTLRVDLPAARYAEPPTRLALANRLREDLLSIAGVRSATVWGPGLPGRATWVALVAPEERPVHSPADLQMVWRHSTNPGGLADLGIRLVQGRDFTTADTADGLPVVIVGRSVARELWPDVDPLGRRLRTGSAPDAPRATVIGVAEDVKMRGRFRFGDLDPRRIPQRDVYFPFAQRPVTLLVLLVRAQGDPEAIAAPVRRAIASADPSLPVYALQTMREVMGREERNVQFAALLMGIYGAVALLLAGSGLYAVLSFAVVRRTREIGVRMALGARRRHVVAEVSRDGLKSVAVGCGAGVVGVVALSPLVRHLFYGVAPHDVRLLAIACAALATVALVACAAPAWRAASVDPGTVLKSE